VREQDVIWTGAIVPGVKGRFPAAPGYEAARKDNLLAFQMHEANCNTCGWFERQRTDAQKGKAGAFGMVHGRCLNPDADLSGHPYSRDREHITVHPADYVGMACHQQRGLHGH
jgi:hypothetical protein